MVPLEKETCLGKQLRVSLSLTLAVECDRIQDSLRNKSSV